MYLYKQKQNKKSSKGDNDTSQQNPFSPSIKPSDIIEKSQATSGNWLTGNNDKRTDKNNRPESSKDDE